MCFITVGGGEKSGMTPRYLVLDQLLNLLGLWASENRDECIVIGTLCDPMSFVPKYRVNTFVALDLRQMSQK